MNRQLVENILTVIKTSTDKSVIVKGLVKLRTDVVKDKDGIILFREAGGVTPVVKFLVSHMSKCRGGLRRGKLLNDAHAPLKVGLKRNQHREKYFEEVARNLEGVQK
ncbi:hypothetical protein EVAR_101382_1 [Eumeta japonica]|uniref:Uncharacterized protein n=1 Tax=Eumeta variegata TaxID=151549 RepID=A0A4C1SKW1_EUMVA|nr:hypothetical protein EVAR_101382_1 [Eumeta japonica]